MSLQKGEIWRQPGTQRTPREQEASCLQTKQGSAHLHPPSAQGAAALALRFRILFLGPDSAPVPPPPHTERTGHSGPLLLQHEPWAPPLFLPCPPSEAWPCLSHRQRPWHPAPRAAQGLRGSDQSTLISATGPEGPFISPFHAVQRKLVLKWRMQAPTPQQEDGVGAGPSAPAAPRGHSCCPGTHLWPQGSPVRRAASEVAFVLLT